MPFRRVLLQLPTGGETGISRVAHHRRRAIAICVLFLGSLQLSPAPSLSLEQPPENSTIAEEPITPIPEPPTIDPLKIKLGNVYSAILACLTTIRAVARRATISAQMARA